MNIYDTITFDQIECGDQIIVDGDPIEVDFVGHDPEAPVEGIRVKGYSHETGDGVTYDRHFSTTVELWAI